MVKQHHMVSSALERRVALPLPAEAQVGEEAVNCSSQYPGTWARPVASAMTNQAHGLNLVRFWVELAHSRCSVNTNLVKMGSS